MSIVVENSTVLSALTEKFAEVFGDTKEVEYFFSPGRINLIGDIPITMGDMFSQHQLQLEQQD
jgi:aspartate ammonia-lyase